MFAFKKELGLNRERYMNNKHYNELGTKRCVAKLKLRYKYRTQPNEKWRCNAWPWVLTKTRQSRDTTRCLVRE